jgi:enoyl-CoA hydratase/carnithine racemase
MEQTMNYEDISLTVTAGLASIRFERPHASNAMTSRLRLEMTDAMRVVKRLPDARALVITGAGTVAFSSGQDTSEKVDPSHAAEWMTEWGDLYEAVLDLDIPTLAAINGFAAGGGLQVALLADMRVAAHDATICLNEIDKAIPAITGAALLAPLTSSSMIQDLILTGRSINGDEALQAGIVSRSIPRETFLREVAELGERLAAVSATAVKLNKDWWRVMRGDLLSEAIAAGRKAHLTAFAARATPAQAT